MKRSKCLLIGLGVVCLAIIPLTGCIGVSQSEYEALQANYEALQAKHGILLEENTRLEASIEAKNATIQERQNELDNMSEELSSTKHEVAMYEEELELYKDTWGSVVASNIEPPYYRIYLTNNEAAVNPTFAELESFLREDKTHGDLHYNADDQIIFPTTEGHIFRLPRKDAPDHYFTIAGSANMLTIADAYNLPEQKTGPIEQYSEREAKLYVDLLPYKEA